MSTFAEDNMYRLGLTRCPECPGDRPVIPSDGPVNARCLFLGQGPGKEENSRGRCFIGQGSREFNEHYLPLAGLTRGEVRLANTYRCMNSLPPDSTKSLAIQASCSAFHLRREILQQKPEIIIPMGAVAHNLVEGLNNELQHGIPMKNTSWWGHTCTTFPISHPALSMHRTNMIQELREDFTAMGEFLRGEMVLPVDEYAEMEDYRLLNGKREVRAILGKYGVYTTVNIDTEYDDIGIFCLTFSMEPGTGYMILATDADGLREFSEWLMGWNKGTIAFHNAMADLDKLLEVGIAVPMKRLDDTMLRAYLLQNQPQGLKVLSYRLCGVVMTEYNDVVLPYSVGIMSEYIISLSMEDWPKPEEQLVLTKEGNYKLYKPAGLNTKLKRLITDLAKSPKEKAHKVFDRWEDWSDDERLPAIQKFGLMPRPTVRHVPLKRLIRYACCDADLTGRVRTKLIRLKRNIRHGV